MPLKIPKHIGPQTRSLIEAALEDAWQELNKDGDLETTPARNKLRTTIVALASGLPFHAWRGALQAEQSSLALHARMSGTPD